MKLDDVIPNPHHRMGHSRNVGAPRTVVWDELFRVPMSALPLGRALEGVRLLPAQVSGGQHRPLAGRSRAAATIPGWMIRSGWCRPWRGSWADRSAPSAQVPEADDRAGQADHGLVGIGAALVAGAEPSEAMTPGEGASQKANALPRLVVKSPRRRTTRLPNTDEQRLLQLPSGVPVTRNIRTAYAGEQPVEVLDTISNGEVVSYRFEIKV
jgi:hypothetical protein